MNKKIKKIRELNFTLSKAIYKMQKKEIIERLRPFYNKFVEFESFSRHLIHYLEKEMNKQAGLNKKLEFFYNEAGVCIGAENYEDKRVFPRIRDSEFEK